MPLQPSAADFAHLQPEVSQCAADIGLRIAQLFQHELAIGQKHPFLVARHRLHMHRAEHVDPNHLCDPARVVAVALVHRT